MRMDPPIDNALFTDIYSELKRRARNVRRGQIGNTLDTTALVHEAWLKLGPQPSSFVDRQHFVRTTTPAPEHRSSAVATMPRSR
jgi:DNA-directed RNA polymerase specialized sigma24 family protein